MRPAALLLLLLGLHGPAGAQGSPRSAAFVTRLGNDTIAVERVVRDRGELRAEVLLRVPRTTLHVYRMRLDASGRPVRLETTAHDPALGVGSPALSREVIDFGADSLRIETTGGRSPGRASVAGGRDVLPFIDMVHWPFELVLQRAHAARGDSLAVPLLTGRRTQPFVVRRVGASDYTITHPFRGTMTARVGPGGVLAELDASRTTRALRVSRVAAVDLPALARRYAAIDAQGRPLGELSGRGEARGTLGGAAVAVDFGRPAKRGREIFGRLVPWGQVWRTGANRATHLTTDRDLLVGGTRVPAGTYTLFTIPGPDAWTLIVNRRTDINGTAYDAAHDLARIPMQTRTLPEVVENFTVVVDEAGGALRLQWDTLEAYVPVRAAGPGA